jgi:hypothetical protein
MNPRTLATLFVGVLLAAMMIFAVVTNGERVASTHDHTQDVIRAAAAAGGGSHQPGHTDGRSAHRGDQAGDHTSAHEDSHLVAGASHAEGHTDTTGPAGSGGGAHSTGHDGHARAPNEHSGDDDSHGGSTHVGDGAPPGVGGDPGHDHGPAPGGTPTDPGSSGVTPEQAAAAAKLIVDTKVGLEQWQDADKVHAAGFRTIGDGGTGYEHLVNWNWIDDGIVLDPNHPESLVYRVTPEGRVLEAAMYVLPFGTADEDIPDIGGTLTQWHVHNNLCFTPEQITDGYPQRSVIGLTDAAGNCHSGEKLPLAPMLHVWIVDHPCGPFASLDGVGAGQAVNEPQDPNADPACQHSAH